MIPVPADRPTVNPCTTSAVVSTPPERGQGAPGRGPRHGDTAIADTGCRCAACHERRRELHVLAQLTGQRHPQIAQPCGQLIVRGPGFTRRRNPQAFPRKRPLTFPKPTVVECCA